MGITFTVLANGLGEVVLMGPVLFSSHVVVVCFWQLCFVLVNLLVLWCCVGGSPITGVQVLDSPSISSLRR